MLSPKKVKFRKMMKGKMRGTARRGATLNFGEYGLQAVDCGYISAKQIEAARIAMTRHVKRGGKIWIRIFPDKSVTLKGSEVRMGGGKGAVDHYVAVIKRGAIMFEMGGIDREVAKTALKLAAYKLPVRTIFIEK